MKAVALYLFVALLSRCQKVMGCILVVVLVEVVLGMLFVIEVFVDNVAVEHFVVFDAVGIVVVVVVGIVVFC